MRRCRRGRAPVAVLGRHRRLLAAEPSEGRRAWRMTAGGGRDDGGVGQAAAGHDRCVAPGSAVRVGTRTPDLRRRPPRRPGPVMRTSSAVGDARPWAASRRCRRPRLMSSGLAPSPRGPLASGTTRWVLAFGLSASSCTARQVAQVRADRVGRQHEHPAVPRGEVGVGDAAQPAVDVAAAADLDGREDAGHGAAGRDGALERHAAGVVEDHRGAGLGVDRGDEQAALGPRLADQAEADGLEPVLLGGRARGERGLADEGAAAALVEVQLGAQVAGGVGGAEPAVARQRRALLDPGERVALVGADPQVGRDHRARGGADHRVGVAHVDAAVAQADDDAGLPGDAGRSPAGEHEGAVEPLGRLLPLAEALAATTGRA